MADALRKYGTQTAIVFPLFAPGDVNPTSGLALASGDVTISKDGGAFAATTNAASEIGSSGWYSVTLTSTEMSAGTIILNVQDADMETFEWFAMRIETYGNASAQHAFDLGTAVQPVNLTQIDGTANASATLNLAKLHIRAATGPAVEFQADSGVCLHIDGGDQYNGVSVRLNDGASSYEWDLVTGSMVHINATANAFADAVFNETLSEHAIAGSAGKALSDVRSVAAKLDAMIEEVS